MMNRTAAPEIPPDLVWVDPSEDSRSGAGDGRSSDDDRRSLAERRGTFVLLDFWTRSCVNCKHMADELDLLCARYGDRLAVIGVHSPKFPAERDDAVVRAGMEQADYRHPVVNDPDLRLWRLYGVQAWPTVVLIDPVGNLVAVAVGEAEIPGLKAHLDRLLDIEPRRPQRSVVEPQPVTEALRYPNRVLAVGPNLLVSETGGDVVLLDSSASIVRRFDGFVQPMGLCLLPDDRVAVADAGRHQVLVVDLDDGRIEPLAGSGRRGDRRVAIGSTSATQADLASPHDVVWWHGRLVIALAGQHQLLAVPDADPEAMLELVAGSSIEGHKNGSAKRARLAMPTAMAVDGERLWFVDADSSALRWVEQQTVATAIGESVAISGHRDGPSGQALLQHPAGITIDAEGRVLIADVFNGAVRRFDPGLDRVETIAVGLAEPTDVLCDGEQMWVIERSGSGVRTVQPDARSIDGDQRAFTFPPTEVMADLLLTFVGHGEVELAVSAEPAGLFRSIDRPPGGDGSEIILRLDADVGAGSIEVEANRRDCEELCTVMRSRWYMEVVVTDDGVDGIPLVGR